MGVSGSGKTTTLECLISKLSAEGYKSGAIKHVHHIGFTIDKEGTNTWRFAQAGSKVIIAISPEEIDIIHKKELEPKNIDKILALLDREKLDIIFIEGFHSLIAKRKDIMKIITAKDQDGLEETLKGTSNPILAISGVISKNSNIKRFNNVPIVKIPEEADQLLQLIKQELNKS